jgi:hypothetical protein
MISTPRAIEYELMVLSFAHSLLEHFGTTTLYRRSSLEEDLLLLDAEADYRRSAVLQYNI